MRSRQLSEIRIICGLLGVDTLHGKDNMELDAQRLKQAKEYAWRNRYQLASIFGYKGHFDAQGSPHPYLRFNHSSPKMRDPQLYVLNRVLAT